MTEADKIAADYEALNELLVNCPDFERLESLLGGFNLFQVLKFEYGEIRHSNVLAWIMDPEESHGLDALFLQKWLMRIIHECSQEIEVPITPADIDGWQLADVEVRREWKNIDLLLVIKLISGHTWTICIENKIKSRQHSNQLARYRSMVESTFPDAARRIYVFLSNYDEIPEDSNYICATYTQIHRVLKECLQSRNHAIGAEPKVLLENYLRLLEEKFMEESEIARTALRIYQQHRRALDLIFEHRPDSLRSISEKVRQLLTENAEEMGIIVETCNKRYLRFIPREWDCPGNTHGTAWAGMNRTIVFEMSIYEGVAYLYVMSGKAPDGWINRLWERADSPPFKKIRKYKVRPRFWVGLHMFKSIPFEDENDQEKDPVEVAQKIIDQVRVRIQSDEAKEIIRIISEEIPALEQAYANR